MGNGPVLYEAYYPDNEDQEIPQNLEKKIYNENPVIEKSHQQSYTENYPDTRSQFDDNFNQQNYPGQDDYISTQQIPPYVNQQPNLNNKIIENNNHQQTASLEDAINILINAIREKKIEAHPVYQNFQPQNNELNYQQQNKLNFQPQTNRLNYQQQNKLNYQPRNNKLNYQSNKEKFNYQTNERSLIESGKFIFPNENFGYENKKNNRRFDDNIYEPRPQVLFSPTHEPLKIQSFDPTLTRSSSFIAENERGGEFFTKNLIKMREKNLEKPRVSSIQVSQESRHKHRHHHGEKIRSNYQKPSL